MRQTLLFTTAILLLLSCDTVDTPNVSKDTATLTQPSARFANKSERQILVEELKRLHAVLNSKDKERIAGIFEFPLADTTVGIYIDDSTFNAQYEKDGNKATRALFLRHFRDISESLQIDQVIKLFERIDIDSLLQKDTLEHEAIIKAEPCYHFYRVRVEKDDVTLTVGTNSNKDYKSRSVSELEVAENSSEMCEHELWWVFRFDRKQLHFQKILAAG